jgi:acyl-CoA thioester hydrolase
MNADLIQAPFDQFRATVRPEWIDNNDHMNMGYYMVVFDEATDDWLNYIGLDGAHRQDNGITTFCVEGHITYDMEIRVDAPLHFRTRLLDFDEKRIHYIHEMYHGTEGFLASTNELMSLHVSLATRRAAPMHPDIQTHLAKIKAVHDQLPPLPQAGRHIGLRQRK